MISYREKLLVIAPFRIWRGAFFIFRGQPSPLPPLPLEKSVPLRSPLERKKAFFCPMISLVI
jgi:hypothetical protein